MSKIIGNTIATPTPRSDWNQVDETKADFILNKPQLGDIAEKDIIEKSDLASDVQASLNKADAALDDAKAYTDTKTSGLESKSTVQIVRESTTRLDTLTIRELSQEEYDLTAIDDNQLYLIPNSEEDEFNIEIDDMLSDESENPVQNRVVKAAIEAVQKIANSAVPTSGGTMIGTLKAAVNSNGSVVVRNIGYGTTLPETLGDGELFVLIPE